MELKAQTYLLPRCPECHGERIEAIGSRYMEVNIEGTFSSSPLRAMVCTQCGFTTFYAENPKNLLKSPNKAEE